MGFLLRVGLGIPSRLGAVQESPAWGRGVPRLPWAGGCAPALAVAFASFWSQDGPLQGVN